MRRLFERATAWLVEPRDDLGSHDDRGSHDDLGLAGDPGFGGSRQTGARPAGAGPAGAGRPSRVPFAPPVARRATREHVVRQATVEDGRTDGLAALRRDVLIGSPEARQRWDTPAEREAVGSPDADRGPSKARVRGRRRARKATAETAPSQAADAVGAGHPVVLGPEDDVPPVAAALALALRARTGAAAGIVLLWRPRPVHAIGSHATAPGSPTTAATADVPGDPTPAATREPGEPTTAERRASSLVGLPGPALATPGLPGARLVAGRLNRRGLTSAAHGRLVWVLVPPDIGDAAAALRRTAAAAGVAPSVLALLGPRDGAVDAVVGACDLAVVAVEPRSPLAEMAATDLGALGMTVHAFPPSAGPTRLALLAGLRTPPRESRTRLEALA